MVAPIAKHTFPLLRKLPPTRQFDSGIPALEVAWIGCHIHGDCCVQLVQCTPCKNTATKCRSQAALFGQVHVTRCGMEPATTQSTGHQSTSKHLLQQQPPLVHRRCQQRPGTSAVSWAYPTVVALPVTLCLEIGTVAYVHTSESNNERRPGCTTSSQGCALWASQYSIFTTSRCASTGQCWQHFQPGSRTL